MDRVFPWKENQYILNYTKSGVWFGEKWIQLDKSEFGGSSVWVNKELSIEIITDALNS